MVTFSKVTLSKLLLAAALISVLTALLSGCASPSEPSPSPTISNISDAQAAEVFSTIVDASIAKANQVGITQTTVNSEFGTYLLVADKSSSTYRATIKNADGTFELLAQADAFIPWAAKAWLESGAKVSFDSGSYGLTREIEGTPTDYVFEVSNGLLLSESGKSVQATWISTLNYEVTAEGLEVLKIGSTLPTKN
jgi:hypothetical protein